MTMTRALAGAVGGAVLITTTVGWLKADSDERPPKLPEPSTTIAELKENVRDLKKVELALLQNVTDLTREVSELKKTMQQQAKTIAANYESAGTSLNNLKTWIVNQEYRVEWRWIGGRPPTGPEGATFVADFGKHVVDATAFVCHTNLSYGRDDHHVRDFFSAANVESTNGSRVTVRYRACMQDGSGHRAGGGIEVIVLARVK